MDLNGKVALVTGGARGIGKSFTEHLMRNNVKVVIVDIKKELGDETKTELGKKFGQDRIRFIQCDVTNETQLEDAIKETIKSFGKLDILINNAGIAVEQDPGWIKNVQINFVSLVISSYLGLKYMGKDMGKSGGTIVNIGSITCFEPIFFFPVYSATKSAVNQFTRCIGLKTNFDRTGVRVVAINPGATETPIVPETADLLRPEDRDAFWAQLKDGWPAQSADNMGKGLIDVLKKAESGSLWVIEEEVAPKRVEFIVKRHEN